uniref:Uncharacterized protein n=1 Tax=Trepomonas sp. PC1 TaxID=1076344 RepID=A0A146K0T4_9EUKA|eukprot:JAP90503.1 Hypothetical protein TPC1_30002 [Trepomonas sp. PC1]
MRLLKQLNCYFFVYIKLCKFSILTDMKTYSPSKTRLGTWIFFTQIPLSSKIKITRTPLQEMKLVIDFDLPNTDREQRTLIESRIQQYNFDHHEIQLSTNLTAPHFIINSTANSFGLVVGEYQYFRQFHESTIYRTTLMAVLLAHILNKEQKQFVFEVEPSIVDVMQTINNYDYSETYNLLQQIKKFNSTIQFVPFAQQPDQPSNTQPPDVYYDQFYHHFLELPDTQKYYKNLLQYLISEAHKLKHTECTLKKSQFSRRNHEFKLHVRDEDIFVQGLHVKVKNSTASQNALLAMLVILQVYDEVAFILFTVRDLKLDNQKLTQLVKNKKFKINFERKPFPKQPIDFTVVNLPSIDLQVYMPPEHFLTDLGTLIDTISLEQKQMERQKYQLINLKNPWCNTINFIVLSTQNSLTYKRNGIQITYNFHSSCKIRTLLMGIILIVSQYKSQQHNFIFYVNQQLIDQFNLLNQTEIANDLIVILKRLLGNKFIYLLLHKHQNPRNYHSVQFGRIFHDNYFEQHSQSLLNNYAIMKLQSKQLQNKLVDLSRLINTINIQKCVVQRFQFQELNIANKSLKGQRFIIFCTNNSFSYRQQTSDISFTYKFHKSSKIRMLLMAVIVVLNQYPNKNAKFIADPAILPVFKSLAETGEANDLIQIINGMRRRLYIGFNKQMYENESKIKCTQTQCSDIYHDNYFEQFVENMAKSNQQQNQPKLKTNLRIFESLTTQQQSIQQVANQQNDISTDQESSIANYADDVEAENHTVQQDISLMQSVSMTKPNQSQKVKNTPQVKMDFRIVLGQMNQDSIIQEEQATSSNQGEDISTDSENQSAMNYAADTENKNHVTSQDTSLNADHFVSKDLAKNDLNDSQPNQPNKHESNFQNTEVLNATIAQLLSQINQMQKENDELRQSQLNVSKEQTDTKITTEMKLKMSTGQSGVKIKCEFGSVPKEQADEIVKRLLKMSGMQ